MTLGDGREHRLGVRASGRSGQSMRFGHESAANQVEDAGAPGRHDRAGSAAGDTENPPRASPRRSAARYEERDTSVLPTGDHQHSARQWPSGCVALSPMRRGSRSTSSCRLEARYPQLRQSDKSGCPRLARPRARLRCRTEPGAVPFGGDAIATSTAWVSAAAGPNQAWQHATSERRAHPRKSTTLHCAACGARVG